jgi:hypothetical protein
LRSAAGFFGGIHTDSRLSPQAAVSPPGDPGKREPGMESIGIAANTSRKIERQHRKTTSKDNIEGQNRKTKSKDKAAQATDAERSGIDPAIDTELGRLDSMQKSSRSETQ